MFIAFEYWTISSVRFFFYPAAITVAAHGILLSDNLYRPKTFEILVNAIYLSYKELQIQFAHIGHKKCSRRPDIKYVCSTENKQIEKHKHFSYSCFILFQEFICETNKGYIIHRCSKQNWTAQRTICRPIRFEGPFGVIIVKSKLFSTTELQLINNTGISLSGYIVLRNKIPPETRKRGLMCVV